MLFSSPLVRRLALIFSATVLLAVSGCTSTSPPSGISAVTPFDLARYEGRWYEVARWEIKKQLGYHLWEDLKHSQLLRTRLWELRINTPDRDLDPGLAEAIERLAVAQHDYEAIAGIYLALKTELLAAYRRRRAQCSRAAAASVARRRDRRPVRRRGRSPPRERRASRSG